ncbi:MAG: hypothetical protein ACRD0U_01850, partial [Acidimicrobiales bacterium]
MGQSTIALFSRGQASASVPARLRSTGQDLDVALHLTINLAQPRPLLSDNKVVEMRRRRCRSGNGQADLRVERVPRRLYRGRTRRLRLGH